MRRAIGSWSGGWLVRRVTSEDICELLGDDIDPRYCALMPVGFAADRDGVLVAAGSVTWDTSGRAWGWLNCRERVPVRIMHTCATEMLRMLREVHEPFILMIVNISTDGAELWARRLGFVPDDTLRHSWGPVYRCDLLS